MDLLEVQAISLLDKHSVPVSEGLLAVTAEEAYALASRLQAPVMVKAQVKVGGRGKAGGVKFAAEPEQARTHAQDILGKDIKGHIARSVLITKAVSIVEEYYLSFLVDRAQRNCMALCSHRGGTDIEEIARKYPDELARVPINPLVGVTDEIAREIMVKGKLPVEHEDQLLPIIKQLWEVFHEEDASLVEINPLALTKTGKILCADAKITIDDNALFRHPYLNEYYDHGDIHPLESKAHNLKLNYVKLDGEIGIIGNGAGLVMSTLDVVALAGEKHQNVKPANFLDIGGGASAKVMANGLDVIFSDPQVKSIFVNVFGGITACDEVAKGIVQALDLIEQRSDKDGIDKNIAYRAATVPIVVRLDGNNVAEGRQILERAGKPQIHTVATMDDAADEAARLANV